MRPIGAEIINQLSIITFAFLEVIFLKVYSWNEVLKEIEQTKNIHPLDSVRRKYLKRLSQHTKRPTIAYYSGWLSRSTNSSSLIINDEDKNALMTAVHKLQRDNGLDIILHTPGGDLAAAESMVNYLRAMFTTDIRAIIPQIAMSAGTMIACSCKTIIMGKQSNLGPIDPQIRGMPASGVLEEFDDAIKKIKENPESLPLWQSIIGKYHPTFLGECKKSMAWAEDLAADWLKTGMFKDEEKRDEIVDKIVKTLSDHNETKNHSRHIHIDDCFEMGLDITRLEDDPKLQDLVLTTHHAFMHTFSATNALKIVENNLGDAQVKNER